MTTHDIAIVGAGAAGLAAAHRARELGLTFVLLEASHRIGGRAYTEEVAPGIPFDLGCHWLHSASLNPFVAVADRLGIAYERLIGWPRRMFREGRWFESDALGDWDAYYERADEAIEAAAAAGRDISIAEATERDSPWTAFYDYFTTLGTSKDSDEVCVFDVADYHDTGENWPVRDGYGTLVARWAADIPVTLNARAQTIAWGGPLVRIATPKGTVEARAAVIAVGTGVLGHGDIRFDPPLPAWKRDAIDALPLGNHNRICIVFDRDVFGPGVRGNTIKLGDDEPMSFQVMPFGFPLAIGVTGGRFADWLERAGAAASVDHALQRLKAAYGNDVAKHVVKSSVTAWGGDPWTHGAYSAHKPGAGRRRADLARPVDGRLFFAGEAASTRFFSTCHGAYLTGLAAAEDAAATLAGAGNAAAAAQ